MLAQVASRTGQHEVVNTVSGDISPHYSTQWESMIDVVDILTLGLLESSLAIVALVALTFELILNLIMSVCTPSSHFASATVMVMGTIALPYPRTTEIGFAMCSLIGPGAFLHFWALVVGFSV